MQIIDTHSHIFQPDFDEDIEQVIQRAKDAGVTSVLLPNIDTETVDRLHTLSNRYPDYCFPMMGLHPTSVGENWKNDLITLKEYFSTHNYIAVGEIGIDLYWDKTHQQEQTQAFEEQLRWSIEYDLPVSIHSRSAIAECVQCIKNVGTDKLRGVFHSFGGTKEELEEILSLGNFYLGINGTVTFKNSTLPTVLLYTSPEKLIIETDAPYLAPVPYRGKRNEPSYTNNIVTKLAEIYQISSEEIGKMTSANASKLFGI